jgi:hypothetical protein
LLGRFGERRAPYDDSWQGTLDCDVPGQTSTANMTSLPAGVGTTQPSVVDVHAYPCMAVAPSWACDENEDGAGITDAYTLYNDVWAFLSYRGLTGGLMVFGESSVTSSWNVAQCGWQPEASWVVYGYAGDPGSNPPSLLYDNHSSLTVFSPFNNFGSCYSNPITLAPYN